MVIIYSNPNCSQCEMTKKYLAANGVAFESKMINDSPEVLSLIAEKDYRAAPVVVAGDRSWSGFNREELLSLVESNK